MRMKLNTNLKALKGEVCLLRGMTSIPLGINHNMKLEVQFKVHSGNQQVSWETLIRQTHQMRVSFHRTIHIARTSTQMMITE
jgi:hypothetical protein